MTSLETRPATPTEVTFPVTGMTCASCVRRIEKALGKVDGVSAASVNLATEQAHVVFDPDRTSVDDMRTAVERAGYSIGTLAQPSTSAEAHIAEPSAADTQE